MFNGKTILKTEVSKLNKYVQEIKFFFTDGTNLVITSSPAKGMYFNTFDNYSGRYSEIHPANID